MPREREVRDHLLERLDGPLRAGGLDPTAVGDDLDLLRSGILDSLGLLELIADVNDRFDIEVDFEEVDPEELTVLGPFVRHVAAAAEVRVAPTPDRGGPG